MVLQNPSGLHARLAAAVVRAARSHEADVTLTNLDRDASAAASASSIVALLGLGAAAGSRLRIRAHGPAAAQAVSAVRDVLAAPRDGDRSQ